MLVFASPENLVGHQEDQATHVLLGVKGSGTEWRCGCRYTIACALANSDFEPHIGRLITGSTILLLN
jgi:hypothetical protein